MHNIDGSDCAFQSRVEKLENAYQALLDEERNMARCNSDPRNLGSIKEAREALATSHVPLHYEYVELSPTAFLSVTAALTPFSNHNQSPRYLKGRQAESRNA